MSKHINQHKNSNLNERQQQFVDYYVQSLNATESAKRAGYSAKTAYSIGQSNLKNVDIRNAINARLKQLESDRIAETKEILEYLTSVMRGEYEEEIVVNIGKGKGFTQAEKIKTEVTAKDRLKAAEMLAKVNGMFITKQELDVHGTIPVVIKDDM